MNTRILVVDDELDTLNLLRTILEISGYTPITTLNSIDAIGLAEVEKPDVILLDIMMPKLDGFTLCKMMRQHTTTKDLPIIFVTAYESLDIEQRRVEAGADLVIHKPINMDELIEAVSNIHTLRAQAAATAQPGGSNGAPKAAAPTVEPPTAAPPPSAPPVVKPPTTPPRQTKPAEKTQETKSVKPKTD